MIYHDKFLSDKTNASPPPTSNTDNTTSKKPQAELERVRELILGSGGDASQPRMRKTEVDRLREILFGSQMQEYERRFTDIRREVERALTDLRSIQDRVGDFEKEQTKQIENLERLVRQSHDETKRELDRLRNQETMVQQLVNQTRQQEMLAQGLSKTSSETNTALSKQERDIRTLRTTLGEQRDQYERKLDVLKREARQAEDGLWAELRRVADQLGDQKTDRKALSGMLMEVATRLETGNTVTGLLEDLTVPSQE